MPLVALSAEAIEDLARLSEFLAASDPAAAAGTGPLIVNALRILETHPHIGSAADDNTRDLVISRGRTGYVARYTFDPVADRGVVHTIRHQGEIGLDED